MVAGIGDGSANLDRLDRQLLHALVVDGRVPFRRLAPILGASEQTLARRYRRLRDAGIVHVMVAASARDFDQVWGLRVEVRPSASAALGEALARRADTAWVALVGGGAEVSCFVRTRDREVRDGLLLDQLPQSDAVRGVQAFTVIHEFSGPGAQWSGVGDPLSAAQIAAIDAVRPAGAGDGPVNLGADDRAFLEVLAVDGRASYARVAAAVGRPEAPVARRLDHLLRTGALYVDVELAPDRIGFPVQATLWLTVAPGSLSVVGEQVARQPDVPFAAATTGPTNLMAPITCRSHDDLYRAVTERIGRLPGVDRVEISPVLRRLKLEHSHYEGDRLVPPFSGSRHVVPAGAAQR